MGGNAPLHAAPHRVRNVRRAMGHAFSPPYGMPYGMPYGTFGFANRSTSGSGQQRWLP